MRDLHRLLNREPWYKPWIRRIEHATKRASFDVIGSWLSPKEVSAPLSLDDIKSILILRYDALGDMVLTTPIIRILKSRKPSLILGVAGSRKNLDLIHDDPDVDHRYTFIQKSNEGMWSEIKRAREVQWDVIINLVYNDKTRAAIISRLIAPNAIRITAVRGPVAQYRKLYSIVTARPPLRPPVPMLEQFLSTLTEAINISITPDEKLPSLKLATSIVSGIHTEIANKHKERSTSRLVVLNTSSSEMFREWGYENAWEFSKQLTAKLPEVLVFWTGAPDKKEILREFIASRPLARAHYFETPTPTHLAALIGESELVISPDTSVIHIACAERKPVVGLFMEANEFLPYGVPNIVLMPEAEQPLKTISVKSVLDAAMKMLSSREVRALR